MKNIILILTATFLFICCSDDSTGPSSNEKGHFSVKYNGEYWIPEADFDLFHGSSHGSTVYLGEGSYLKSYFDSTRTVLVGATNDELNHSITFRIHNVHSVGLYEIYDVYNVFNGDRGFGNSDLQMSKVEITDLHIDTTHVYNSDEEKWYVEMKKTSFVKGKFEFTFEDEEGNTLNVTEGKFFLENQSYYNY